ncbi:MAG: hypothetical protein IT223_03765 [Crocinitomicaceae bacterium]|nr:hypothetical protein [Crocinitomicaceae bacterium]
MNNKVYIGIIAVLLGVVGYMGYSLNQKNEQIMYVDREKNTILDERDVLSLQLEDMKMSYDTLSTDNEEMAAQIEQQKNEIEALIKKAKNKDYDISKLKKETETLRTIMKGYIHQIDSLNQANDRLTAEKADAESRALTAEEKSRGLESDLSTKNEMINKGSVLTTGEFASTGINLRSSGKQVETDRASKCEMLKTCFTVRKNAIIKPGTKNLFLKIIGPDGTVLPGKETGTISVSGKEETYSVTREIDYQQQDTDVCVFYTAMGTLKKGNYKIFIYEGGNMIGQTDLTLK